MEGWKCPVCGRGVNPNEKTCNHGATPVYAVPTQTDCDCPLGYCRYTVCPRYVQRPFSMHIINDPNASLTN